MMLSLGRIFSNAAMAFLATFACATAVLGTELQGTVAETTHGAAKIRIAGELLPNVDDPAKIFFKLPGSDDEVLVGNGKVTEVTRLALEAIGSEFTVFVDGKLVAKFTGEKLDGRQLGFCLAGSGPDTCVAAFDNLRVYAAAPAAGGAPVQTP